MDWNRPIVAVVLVAATAGMSNLVRTAAAALPDAAFVAMGVDAAA